MENQKPKSKGRKVLSVIGNILMWLFIAFAVVVTIFAFSAQSSADGIPTVVGKVMSPVLSDSMAPTINKGDIIFSTKLSESDKQNLAVGDIITFKADLDGDGQPEVNTHRIVELIKNGSGTLTSVRTKGDNNLAQDNYTVSTTDIISLFTEGKSTKIAVLGSVIAFLLTPTGFFVVIVIPLILFFLFEIIMFVRKLMEVKNAGKKQITAEDEELIKQKAIEEYLRAQKQAQEHEETSTDSTTSEKTSASSEEPQAETETSVEETQEEK